MTDKPLNVLLMRSIDVKCTAQLLIYNLFKLENLFPFADLGNGSNISVSLNSRSSKHFGKLLKRIKSLNTFPVSSVRYKLCAFYV